MLGMFRRFFVNDKVHDYFKHIYKGDEYRAKLLNYEKEKIKHFWMIIIAGVIVSFLLGASNKSSVIEDGARIKRNGYGKGNRSVDLIVSSEDIGISKEITLNVSEQKYTDIEIQNIYEDFIKVIESIVLGENQSNDKVLNSMNFAKQIDGYPFVISYETDNPTIVNGDGSINNEKLEELDCDNKGVITAVTVKSRYYDFENSYTFFVKIFRQDLSIDEKFEKVVISQLNAMDSMDVGNDFYQLPNSAGGVQILFKEKDDYSEFVIIFITIIVAVLYCAAKDEEIKNKYVEREEQMLMDYPSIINRFALYYNAGMTVKATFSKICDEYEKEKQKKHIERYAYEEMLSANNAMKDGVGEIKAYDDFANRCNLQKYRNFVSLIKQAVTKGKRDLGTILMDENINVFNDRKLKAKKLSEEAGTKLLIPMFMMLTVVIIMIVYPAFASF